MSQCHIFLFHGLGGTEFTCEPMIEHLREMVSQTQFVSVRGTLNFGTSAEPSLGWFIPPKDKDRAFDVPKPPRYNGLSQSLAKIHREISEAIDGGTDPSRIHLVGHSQGGAIALAAGLTYPKRLGGIHTIAGYLALNNQLKLSDQATETYLHHSIHDGNVTVQWAKYAKAYLDLAGIPCKLQCWDIADDPHSVHPCQLDEIGREINQSIN